MRLQEKSHVQVQAAPTIGPGKAGMSGMEVGTTHHGIVGTVGMSTSGTGPLPTTHMHSTGPAKGLPEEAKRLRPLGIGTRVGPRILTPGSGRIVLGLRAGLEAVIPSRSEVKMRIVMKIMFDIQDRQGDVGTTKQTVVGREAPIAAWSHVCFFPVEKRRLSVAGERMRRTRKRWTWTQQSARLPRSKIVKSCHSCRTPSLPSMMSRWSC
mmetsp:Transcript_95314/g.165565  ORF Transcript_95314/g.165565 Transcript_95314/m.165565 type:complete len:209 (+) Transcript_95314:125-751(+)